MHKTKKSVTAVSIRETPSGRVMMTAGNDGTVQIYEQPSHQSVRPLGEDFASFRSDAISMSPGGRWIATGHSDRAKPGVCIWDANPMRHERGVTHGVLVCKLETTEYVRHRGGSIGAGSRSSHVAAAAAARSMREGLSYDAQDDDADNMEYYEETANLPWLWGAVQWNAAGDRVLTLGGERGGEGAAQHCWIFEMLEASLMTRAKHARMRHRRGTTGSDKAAGALRCQKWEVPLRSIGAHDEATMVVQCADFSPGDDILVTGETAAGLAGVDTTWLGGRACVWDVAKIEAGEGGAALLAVLNNVDEAGVPRSIRCLAMDVLKSGETLLVTAGDHGTCSVWDLAKATESGDGVGALHGRLIENDDAMGHHEAASFVAVKFDPRGCGQTQCVRIFTACTDKGCMWEYDVAIGGRGTITGLFERGHHGKSITGADFSPRGDRIVTAGEDGFVSYWDAFPPLEGPDDTELLREHAASHAWRDEPGHIGHVHHSQIARMKCKQHRSLRVEFSPDGEYILTGASDMADGAVALLWPALWNHHELQSEPHIEVCDWSYLERDLGFGPSVGRDNALHAFAARWHSAEVSVLLLYLP